MSLSPTDLEKEVIGELIEELKVHRCLWDSKCETYANRDSRRVALGVLLNIFKKFQPDATIDAIKKKIENLKSSFRRELRKVRASETTGASSSQVYTPKLWFYDLLLFLEEKEMTREGIDTLEEDSQMDVVEPVGGRGQGSCAVEGQERSDQQQHTGPSSTASPAGTPIPRKRKMSTLDKKKEAMFDSVQNLLSARESEWEVIGKSLGLQLSQLNNDQQVIAQKLISDIIFYGKRQRLTDMSFINLGPTSSPHFFQTPPLSTFQGMYNPRFRPPFSPQTSQTHLPSPSPPLIAHSPSNTAPSPSNTAPSPSPYESIQMSSGAQGDYIIQDLQNPHASNNPDNNMFY